MTDMADLKESIGELKKEMRRCSVKTDEGFEKIYKVLNGNGCIGLVTQAALNKTSIKRAWWWLGGISLGILTLALFVIRGHVA